MHFEAVELARGEMALTYFEFTTLAILLCIAASKPDVAIPMYEKMIRKLEEDHGKKIATGIFGADMKVDLLNDGPVTIVIDTRNRE